jgi:hypothetical protein
MLKAKGLPRYFWGEAMSTMVHILNRASTCALDGNTPYEAWHGKVPAIHYFCKFGCITHLKITRPNLKKLDDWSHKVIFIGYEVGSKAYHCYDPVDQRESSPVMSSSTKQGSGVGRTPTTIKRVTPSHSPWSIAPRLSATSCRPSPHQLHLLLHRLQGSTQSRGHE